MYTILTVAIISIPLTIVTKFLFKLFSESKLGNTLLSPIDIVVFSLLYLYKFNFVTEAYQMPMTSLYKKFKVLNEIGWQYSICFFRTQRNYILGKNKIKRLDKITFLIDNEELSILSTKEVTGTFIGITANNNIIIIDNATGNIYNYSTDELTEQQILSLNC